MPNFIILVGALACMDNASRVYALSPRQANIVRNIRGYAKKPSPSPSPSPYIPILFSMPKGEESLHVSEGLNTNSKYIAASILVPVVWGAYSPVVKFLYSSSLFTAPPPLIFTFISYIISFASLASFQFISGTETADTETEEISSESDSALILSKHKASLLGGFELGLWLFLGSSIQLIGINLTSATRAAILIQLTTVLVPLIDSILNKTILSKRIWAASYCVLVGTFLLSADFDTINASTINEASLSQLLNQSFQSLMSSGNLGDGLVCLAAVFYSLHVVRLSAISGQFAAVDLALSINAAKLFFSFSGILLTALISDSQRADFLSYLSNVASGAGSSVSWMVALVLLWNGAIATALTSWCQTFSQQRLPPTTANLIYTLQPLFAGIFSYIFLGERLTGSALGGVGMISIGLLVALSSFTDSLNLKTNVPHSATRSNTESS